MYSARRSCQGASFPHIWDEDCIQRRWHYVFAEEICFLAVTNYYLRCFSFIMTHERDGHWSKIKPVLIHLQHIAISPKALDPWSSEQKWMAVCSEDTKTRHDEQFIVNKWQSSDVVQAHENMDKSKVTVLNRNTEPVQANKHSGHIITWKRLKTSYCTE